ncbi:uncharacterized membrane-anchored protein YhcB (DUF1043 family) [Rhizobium sp. BE258]|nr:uncharacterized membrane-anchored protein YhcB (DUF1043 family) [Rhizobium sp. BE258]
MSKWDAITVALLVGTLFGAVSMKVIDIQSEIAAASR